MHVERLTDIVITILDTGPGWGETVRVREVTWRTHFLRWEDANKTTVVVECDTHLNQHRLTVTDRQTDRHTSSNDQSISVDRLVKYRSSIRTERLISVPAVSDEPDTIELW